MQNWYQCFLLLTLGLMTIHCRAMYKTLPVSEIRTMCPENSCFLLWQELLGAGNCKNVKNLLSNGATFCVSPYFQFYHLCGYIPQLGLDHLDGASVLGIALMASHERKRSEKYMVQFLKALVNGGIQYKYELLEDTVFEVRPLEFALKKNLSTVIAYLLTLNPPIKDKDIAAAHENEDHDTLVQQLTDLHTHQSATKRAAGTMPQNFGNQVLSIPKAASLGSNSAQCVVS